jgi:adenylate cyclase
MTVNTDSSSGSRLLAVGGVCVLGNALSATLVFIYFSVVEYPLVQGQLEVDFFTRLVFFVVAMSVILAVVTVVGHKINLPVWRNMSRRLESGNPEALAVAAGQVLNIPIKMAGLTLTAWVASALVFSFLPPAFRILYDGNWMLALRALCGILFVGTPFAVATIYFTLEWIVRDFALRHLPESSLGEVPQSAKINVLPRILIVCLMIGIVPATLVSIITLHHLYEVENGRQTMGNFVSQMPVVIVFLLSITVITALELSFLVSRSVSRPLQRAAAAMDRVRRGDLEASIPVVSNDEIGRMTEGFNRMVGGLRERNFIRDTFGRYVSEEVATEILKASGEVDLGGEVREITILVSDLRGFTRLSASMGPQRVLQLINRYLERMTDVIITHEGTIDEFTGDGILVFFGAPRRVPDHAVRAVTCAIAMQRSMEAVNQQNVEMGLPALEMGIGINTVELVVGNIGSAKRKKYGAVGSPINVAYRVEAQTAGGEILVTPPVQDRLRDALDVGGTRRVHLKGLDEPLTLYQVKGLIS